MKEFKVKISQFGISTPFLVNAIGSNKEQVLNRFKAMPHTFVKDTDIWEIPKELPVLDLYDGGRTAKALARITNRENKRRLKNG